MTAKREQTEKVVLTYECHACEEKGKMDGHCVFKMTVLDDDGPIYPPKFCPLQTYPAEDYPNAHEAQWAVIAPDQGVPDKSKMRFIVEIENFPINNEWTPETISDAIGQSIDNWLHADGPEGIQNVVLNVRTLDQGGEDAPAPAQSAQNVTLERSCANCGKDCVSRPCNPHSQTLTLCEEYEPAPAQAAPITSPSKEQQTKWIPKGFEGIWMGKHYHYRCKKCGETFCSDDADWSYHECQAPEVKDGEK